MKYFKDEDFKCNCGCGMDVSQEVKEMADKIRETSGLPMVVNSGARCSTHNKSIGASATSSHTLGLAVDFKCTDGVTRLKLVEALITLNVKRIGLHPKFIHWDLDDSKPDNIWFY